MKIISIDNINLNEKYIQKNISMKAKLPNFIKTSAREYNLGNESEFKCESMQAVLASFKNEFLSSILSKFIQNSKKYYIPQNSIDFFTEFDKCLDCVQDKKITDYINKALKNISEKSTESINSEEVHIIMELSDLSNAIDAYNSLKGNYSRLYRPDPWCFSEIRLEPSLQKGYLDILKNNQREFKRFKTELSAYTENPRKRAFWYPVKDFTNIQKYDPITNFSETRNKELENYIYEKYYLNSNSIPKSHLKNLTDIYKTTGIKVVLSKFDKSSLETLKMIKQELEYWQTYSKGTAKFPTSLIVTPINESFINRSAAAYVDMYGNLYIDNEHGVDGLNSSLRHELIHLNDQKQSFFSDYTRDKNLAKLVNSIIKTKEIQENGKTKKILDFEKCKYKEEFLKAGIAPWLIKYGYSNKREFLAVIGSGDLSQCNQQFKNILIKIGLPEYILKMPCPNDTKIKRNVERVKKIMIQNPKLKTYNSIIKYY